MKRFIETGLFFIGWMLSPLTFWNDAFVNIPLSYLLANGAYCLVKLPFVWLVVFFYWFSNIAGLALMFASGKSLLISPGRRAKNIIIMLAFIAIYTLLMLYLDKKGLLLPIAVYLEKFYAGK